jgi:gliding motility-associated-like protein
LYKGKHIIIAFFCIFALTVNSVSVKAQISAPPIHCIAVDSAGNALVTWTIPPDTNSTFLSYDVWSSVNAVNSYTNTGTVFSDNINSVNITGINAKSAPVYFYAKTNTKKGMSDSTGVFSSIFLSVANLGGVAFLQWNAMCNPNLPTFNGWYKIYREYNYVWTLLDSTKALTYRDTITICSAMLNYRIVANDASGCQSSSNWDGGTFSNIIVPVSPFLDTVSVGPGGNIEISWYPSPTKDVTGYYVYEDIGGIWKVIATVMGINNTSYNYTGGSPGTGSQSFEIAAFDSCKNLSPLDLTQHTIYLQQAPQQCAHLNVLSWNAYVNLVPGAGGKYNGVGKYNIFESVNGNPWQLLTTTPDSVTTYTQTGLNSVETLCYYVQVVASTNPNITASSNIVCYQITVPPPPKFSYLRTATVINNSTQNQIDWYIDTGANIESYLVERLDAKGNYTVIGTVPATNSVNYSFIDPTANPNNQSYTYKIFGEDSCGFISDSTSNIGQTIFLTAVGDNAGTNVLTWNDYRKWANNVSHYEIYRDEDYGPYTLIHSGAFANGTETYTDNVSQIITGQGMFGYYIVAFENPPPYPFVDSSTSNIAEAYQDPRLYVPNAFNPKGVNKVFIPVGVFVDLQNYDFTIYDRWGQLLFETTETSQGWDGTFHGKLVEEGVYVYRIQYTSSKGEYFTQRGWVMMLK